MGISALGLLAINPASKITFDPLSSSRMQVYVASPVQTRRRARSAGQGRLGRTVLLEVEQCGKVRSMEQLEERKREKTELLAGVNAMAEEHGLDVGPLGAVLGE